MKKIIFSVLVLSLFGCSGYNEGDEIPKKPNNVPESAFWQGGLDGGQWYECHATDIDFQHNCSVYNDFTGELVFQDNFELYVNLYYSKETIPMKEYINIDTLKAKHINYFDGESVGLQGSLFLKPLNKTIDDFLPTLDK